MEDLESPVGPHRDTDLQEGARQVMRASDEYEGDIPGAALYPLFVDRMVDRVLDVGMRDPVLVGTLLVDGHASIVLHKVV